ncbi:DUF922 domain-containing protein [Usitatibacter palustris]|uniref:DUF922 domain-containing protein n=1 Tax=Usitatibacter palustris TaxID=2732487 RepID=UPI0014881924|nr:DUF922 domain-containing protein [Usitatibacter palustris]
MTTISIEHYEIRGATLDDIRRELDAKGHGGAGSTSGEVTYRFNSARRDGECTITEVRAFCVAKVRLPRWHDVAKTPREVQAFWAKAYDKLKAHEMGHVRICTDIAVDVEKALWAAPKSMHCPAVNEGARKRADSVVREMNERQRAFDAREYGPEKIGEK